MQRFLTAAVGLLLAAAPVAAHHSFAAEFDSSKPIKLRGVITKVQLINPHTWLYVDGRDERGKVAKWSFEMGSTGGLTSRGWKKTDLKTGDHVAVEGFGANSGKNVANPTIITLPDGRKLFGGFAATPGAPK